MDPVTIATTILSVGKNAYRASVTLYQFVRDVKNIDENVASLAAETEAFSRVCQSVEPRLYEVVRQYDWTEGGLRKILQSTSKDVERCNKTIMALETAIGGASSKSDLLKTVKLNLSRSDILALKGRIASHTSTLHLNLQLLNLSITHLAPQKAGRELSDKIEALRVTLDQILISRDDTKKSAKCEEGKAVGVVTEEDPLIDLASEVLENAATLYEASVVAESVIPEPLVRTGWAPKAKEMVPDWLRSLQTIKLEDGDAHNTPDRTLTKSADEEQDSMFDVMDSSETTMTRNAKESAPVWEDEFEVAMAGRMYKIGQEMFRQCDFKAARESFRHAADMLAQTQASRPKIYDLKELQYFMSVCSFHLDDPKEAEAVLARQLDDPDAASQAEGLWLCHLGYLLAWTYTRLGKLEQATSCAYGAVKGRWKLLGDQDPEYYSAVALLARIYELSGQQEKCRMYTAMLPTDVRDGTAKELTQLTVISETSPQEPPPVQIRRPPLHLPPKRPRPPPVQIQNPPPKPFSVMPEPPPAQIRSPPAKLPRVIPESPPVQIRSPPPKVPRVTTESPPVQTQSSPSSVLRVLSWLR